MFLSNMSLTVKSALYYYIRILHDYLCPNLAPVNKGVYLYLLTTVKDAPKAIKSLIESIA